MWRRDLERGVAAGGPIIVKRGFLSALASGFFNFLSITVVCGTGLGGYSLWLLNHNFDRITKLGERAAELLPEWQNKLPAVITDALSDRRDPAYREHVNATVRLAPPGEGQRRQPALAVIEVKNKGNEAISLLALRVVLQDDNDVPRDSFVAYAASPLAIDDCDQMLGPILPGETRRITHELGRSARGLTPVLEVADLRVWQPAPPRTASGATTAADEGSSGAAEPTTGTKVSRAER